MTDLAKKEIIDRMVFFIPYNHLTLAIIGVQKDQIIWVTINKDLISVHIHPIESVVKYD